MKALRVIVFDCDGVLFDTEEANRVYYNHFLEHFGRPEMTPEQLRYVHAHTFHQALEHLFADEEARRAALAYRKKLDYGEFLKYLTIEPDLLRLLPRLRLRYKTAIATNRMDTMHRLLRDFGIAEQFDLVVTSLDVERPKPFPDPLLKILAHFRVEPWQALFVGDSEVDENTAAAAGVPFVAYRNPGLAAARHIERLAELEDLLGG
jgi:HAD superfamily hydrolase (TIGR01509 family)